MPQCGPASWPGQQASVLGHWSPTLLTGLVDGLGGGDAGGLGLGRGFPLAQVLCGSLIRGFGEFWAVL